MDAKEKTSLENPVQVSKSPANPIKDPRDRADNGHPADSPIQAFSSASLFRRLAAAGIDALILIVFMIASVIYSFMNPPGISTVILVCGCFISIAYLCIGNSSFTKGRTVGKRIAGICVQSLKGSSLNIAWSFIRSMVVLAPIFSVAFILPYFESDNLFISVTYIILFGVVFINFYLILFDRNQGRAMHDWVTGSVVVNIDSSKTLGSYPVRRWPKVAAVGCAVVSSLLVFYAFYTDKTYTENLVSETEAPRAAPARHKDKMRELSSGNASTPAHPLYKEVETVWPGISDYHANLRTKFTPPRSMWLEAEKKHYLDLLQDGRYDVLVVPFQTVKGGIDQIERMLMTYIMASRIRLTTRHKVVPPQLAYRALGRYNQMYAEQDVDQLARKLGVQHIVRGYVEIENGDKNSDPLLSVQVYAHNDIPVTDKNSVKYYSLTDMQCAPQSLPSKVFSDNLSDLMEWLDLPGRQKTIPKTYVLDTTLKVPTSPNRLLSEDAENLIQQAGYLQLLASLVPQHADFQRNHLFIRSMAVLLHIDTNSIQAAFLRARAWHHLNRRPMAMKIILPADDRACKTLLELVNANLPCLEKQIGKVQPPLFKLLLQLDLENLKQEYKPTQTNPDYTAITERYPEWQYLLERYLRDKDLWQQHSNLYVKAVLDRDFPIPGFELKKLMQGVAASGGMNENPITQELFYNEHINKVLDSVKNRFAEYRDAPNAYDYLMLLEGIGEANLARLVIFLNDTQGRPEAALQVLQFIENDFRDHPTFTLLHAKALDQQLDVLKGTHRIIATQKLYENALNSMWWNPNQNWSSLGAAKLISKYYGNSIVKEMDHFISPERLQKNIRQHYPFYLPFKMHFERYKYERYLPWTHTDVEILKEVYESLRNRDKQAAQQLLARNRRRFMGHPQRVNMMAGFAESAGKLDKFKNIYKKAISDGSLTWEHYYNLGEMYALEGDYQTASDIFLQYPFFSPTAKVNRVRLSNDAYNAGIVLMLKGAVKESRPLFKFSSGLETGSALCLYSSAHMAMFDTNYARAAEFYLKIGRRYNSAVGYGEGLKLLYAIGDTDTADALFSSQAERLRAAQLWTASLIGHRIRNTNTKDLKKWIIEKADVHKRNYEIGHVARFGLLCLMDRKPDNDMDEFIATVEDTSKYKVADTVVYNPSGFVCGPSDVIWKRDERLARQKRYEEVLPYHASFATGYTQLKLKHYDSALRYFSERGLFYDYNGTRNIALKPYMVYAALKSHNDQLAKKILNGNIRNRIVHRRKFFVLLSDAVYEGVNKNHDKAIELLDMAFAVTPWPMDYPMLPSYVMVEMCELLYEDNKDERYLQRAVKMAKAYQQRNPAMAWAYAVEALYSENESDRLKATGYALYLDPQSERISRISKKEKVRAAKWMKLHNPFLHDNKETTGI